MSVFIGGAWPYANGSLHIGHLAALLPGDILARYYRLRGDSVLYVSGSDCNGTPIEIRANKEGLQVSEIADRYHREFQSCFQDLGFSYDFYSRTDSDYHHREVRNIFKKLIDNNILYEKTTEETYCLECDRFLPDRFVEGNCPDCGERARGDQCDACGRILDPAELDEKHCKFCLKAPILKETAHFYLALSQLQSELKEYADESRDKWRENANNLTQRYLKEGLHDRAVTRDLGNGVTVPVEGYEDKKIYVWIEAVSGYLSAAKEWAEETGSDWKEFWNRDTTSYYVHGKDNIPFHTIIWPAVLKGIKNESLPDWIVSSEYVTLEKRKISTSKDWAVWLPDVLKDYHPDSLRYYFSVNYPDKRDADFSWREFVFKHNSELLGGLGNFIQRTVKFYEKEFGNVTVMKEVDPKVTDQLETVFKETGEWLEKGECRKAARRAFDIIRWGNKYFDDGQPWRVIKEDRGQAKFILESCLYLSLNLSVLLSPFLPFTAEKIYSQFELKEQRRWKPFSLPVKAEISGQESLFTPIPQERIEIERAKLDK
ncbi:methionine--tRNA ligase [Rossellomorea vietnamensis]|uniref:Methionine--tRNA ligase n=1 Tax=Rossellomorea vietnamensis TaxID=218284 RepID=A0A5D4MIA8_9BACI|nr:methionine--tRNA ligase [Rossellomorea vietnamensis]TYS01570.1 methionine--tRNA ligase [Rossellomorea vietnamensis]